MVHVPAFAEEMNKSRRMVGLQSRALAAAGWHVLQLDLLGTGDSEGDFSEATWDDWLADVAQAWRWLGESAGRPAWLWGQRSGALLASACAMVHTVPGLMFWQPVLSGRAHLQQFLRLKAGAEWLGTSKAEEASLKPLDALTAGQAIEVAGYALSPKLALPMAAATLTLPADVARVVWFEVSPRQGATLSPAGESALAPLRASEVHVTAQVVQGPSFWQTQEVETAPTLLAAGIEALT